MKPIESRCLISPSHSPSSGSPARILAIAEWALVLALVGVVIWTALCLGGYLSSTMVISGPAILGLGGLGALLWACGGGGTPRSFHLAVLLPLPFLLYALASVVWQAPAQWLAWREWLLWFQMWIVFALLLHFGRGRGHQQLIMWALLALAVSGVAMAVYQRFSDPSWLMLGRKQAAQFAGRSSGMFGIPNSLAGLFGLIIPTCLTIVSARTATGASKVIASWLAALLLFGLALTGSRGGWLGLGLALTIWPLLAGRTWQRKVAGTAVVLFSVLASMAALYHGSDYARQRMQPFLHGELEKSRPIVWRAAREIWAEHPWFGTGAASYNVVFESYRPRGYQDEPQWTHNDYLNTASDYGIAGFSLWAGAGLALFALGWQSTTRARRAGMGPSFLFASARLKLGLFLGLIAFALHLVVDFHTKIPALAYCAAMTFALLVRDDAGWQRPGTALTRWTAGPLLAAVAGVMLFRIALPAYRAEALRFDARWTIDRFARTRQGDLGSIAVVAARKLQQAVRIDPANGQAWSDLSYATLLSSRRGGDLVAFGRFAELAADEALKVCPGRAEFWLRKGAALDAQRGRDEAEACFRRATALAPNSATAWYSYACHLQVFPERREEAVRALETCLSLDPYYPPAESLGRQLVIHR